MPTILSHCAVPLALGIGFGQKLIPPRLILAGIAASILPDLDVLAFSFGIPYASDAGHRGFSHSLVFAACIGMCCATIASVLRSSATRAFLFIFVAAASHGALDAFTTGGHGIAFLWPFSSERYFAPFRVIEVSPIGISRIFSARGVAVLMSELVWVWLPSVVLAATLWCVRFRPTRAKH